MVDDLRENAVLPGQPLQVAGRIGCRGRERGNLIAMFGGELQQCPAKFAELYGFHHATFAAAIAVLAQEQSDGTE